MKIAEIVAPSADTAFQRWFGASKVVDPNGQPLRVYHGTNQPLDRFDQKRLGASTSSPSSREAFFFTDSPEIASDYARLAGERTRADVSGYEKQSVQLKAASERLEQIAQRSGRPDDWNRATAAMQAWEDHEIGTMRAEPEIGQNIVPVFLSIQNPMVLDARGGSHLNMGGHKTLTDAVAAAKAGGHDGLIMYNLVDAPTVMTPATHFAVFRPQQIKSAFATKFNRRSPRIAESAPKP